MNQEEQNFDMENSSPYLSPMHNYGSAIILLTNPENELHKLELFFRNMQLDKDGNPFPAGEPLLNSHGISQIIGLVQSQVNQVTIMSNLEEKEVAKLIMYFSDTIIKLLLRNYHAFEIKDQTAASAIVYNCTSLVYMSLKRAYKEGDKRFWKGSVQEIKHTQESQNKGNSWMSALNPWSKN